MKDSKRAKKTRSKSKAKADYLDNRDLALGIMGPGGFKKVKAEIGSRLDTVRAYKILKLLKEEYNYKDKDIPRELRDLAGKKKSGHLGGPVTPPEEGEEREYTTGKNGRIGVPLAIIGKKPGDKARVRYSKTKIVIYR